MPGISATLGRGASTCRLVETTRSATRCRNDSMCFAEECRVNAARSCQRSTMVDHIGPQFNLSRQATRLIECRGVFDAAGFLQHFRLQPRDFSKEALLACGCSMTVATT